MQLRQVQNECRGIHDTIKRQFCCIYFSSPYQDQSEITKISSPDMMSRESSEEH